MSGPWEKYSVETPQADGPWGKYASAPQNSSAYEFADQAVRGVYRGVDAMLSIPGAIVGGAADMVSPGSGDQFRWKGWIKPPTEYASGPVEPTTTAGRFGNSIGQAAGSSLIPMVGVAAKAAGPVAAPAQTTIGQIGQNMVNTYRASPGTALAYDAAASVGAGTGQQVAAEMEAGPMGQVVGGLAGALALPMAASGVARVADTVARSPAMARMRPGAQPVPDEPMPQSVGAAANPNAPRMPEPPPTGADAAAAQHIANQLQSAGVRPGQLASRLDDATNASVIGNPNVALVDLDPSMQRLAGSVTRQNMEAGNIGQRFMAGRQTGITPADGMPANAGIPTRQFMTPAAPIDPPMGQFERVNETVRTLLRVPPRSAYRVDQDLVETARREADRLYGDAYRAANGLDIRPYIQPVLDRWRAVASNQDTPIGVARLIEQAIRQFRSRLGTVQSLESFQRAKEFLDDDITLLMNTMSGKQRARAGMMNDIQREMLQAVDSIPNVGQMYANARGAFGSRQGMREALEAGRNALREGSEVSADAYRAMTPGQQQMFRVGLADSLERAMARQKRGADVTQIFQSPQNQALLMEIMAPDDAARLGRNIQTENTMTRSNYEVLGNSKTAQRQADDEAFNQMSGVIDTLRSTRSVSDAAFKFAQRVLDKTLRFRAETAEAMARRLFTADRAELDTVIAQIEARLGPTKAAQFRDMMAQYRSRLIQPAAATTATVNQNDNRRGRSEPRAPNPPRQTRPRDQ